jgi:hypothetical protein
MPAATAIPENGFGVYEIRIAPSNSSIFYMIYNGEIYKTANKGTTWTKTAFAQVAADANDSYRTNSAKMAIDPQNPNVVYVGTSQAGFFVTSDGGSTWQKVTSVPAAKSDSGGAFPGFAGVAFDSSSGVTSGKTNTIYAVSWGNGVYRSTNAGGSWSNIGGPSDADCGFVSGGAYYVGGNTASALYRYKNNAWATLFTSSNGDTHAVAINPLNTQQIVAQNGGGAYNVSNDGGATWSGFNSQNNLTASDIPWLATTGTWLTVGSILFDPKASGKLYTSAGVGVWTTTIPSSGFTNSTTLTLKSQSVGIEQLVSNEIIAPPGGKPIVAGWDQGIFTLNSLSAYPSNHYPGNQIFSAGWSLDYATTNPSFVVALIDWTEFNNNESSAFSTDGGTTWSHFQTNPPNVGASVMGGRMAASTPQNIIWAPSGGVNPYYTLDGGKTWAVVSLPGISDWSGFVWAFYLQERVVVADRSQANTFYLYYSGKGVYRTTDGGKTWKQQFNGTISANDSYNANLQATPGKAGHLFFSGGPLSGTHPVAESFYHSIDGGTTWNAIPNVKEVITFAVGPAKNSSSYPALFIAGWVNNVYGIYQSDDEGQTWTQIGTYPLGSLDNVKTMAADQTVYGQLYIGFSGSGFAYYGP